jgi:fermentation-respiration switch protein FrsA (DUF1100 family)
MRLLLRDTWESWRYASRVTCPTLILAASHDEIVPMGDTRRLLDAFRPGGLKVPVFVYSQYLKGVQATEPGL